MRYDYDADHGPLPRPACVGSLHHRSRFDNAEYQRRWQRGGAARSSPSTAPRASSRRSPAARGGSGVTELADRLELPPPTVHGLLQTLQAHGFVEQDRDSDKYQLGAGLLQLGNSYLDLNELRGALDRARRAARATAPTPPCASACCTAPTVVVVHHVFRPDATLPDARGRRPAARARERARQGDPRLRPRRGRRRPDRRAAAQADAPHAHRARRCAPSSTTCASAASRASATRRCSASRASPRRSSTTPGTRSARSASSATPTASLPRGPAAGLGRRGHRGGARRLARARRGALARRLSVSRRAAKDFALEAVEDANGVCASTAGCATIVASR